MAQRLRKIWLTATCVACAGGLGAERIAGATLYSVSDYTTVGVMGAEPISQMFDSGTLAGSTSVSKQLAVSSSFSQN